MNRTAHALAVIALVVCSAVWGVVGYTLGLGPATTTTTTTTTRPEGMTGSIPATATSSTACERLLDQVVCVTDNGTTRTVEWGPAEDSMTNTHKETKP
jgi:hypothetical protein